MTKIITCGKCDKSFWCLFLAYFIISFLNFLCHPKFSGFYENLDKKEFILIRPCLTYFGQLLMLFYELIFNKINRSEINISSNYKEENSSNQNKNKKKTIIIFGTICTLLLLIDTYKILTLLFFTKFSCLSYIIFNKGWTLVFLFLILVNTYYLKINIYIHQKLAIFIIIILGFVSLIIGMIFKKTFSGEDYFLIFIQIPVSIAEAFIIILINIIILIKDIMENKFYSPMKVCYLIGLINFIISFIILFILSFIKYDSDSSKSIFNISSIFKYGVSLFILFVIVFSLLNGISKLLINIILNKYSMLHLFIFCKIDALLDSSIINIDNKSLRDEQYNYIIELVLQLIEYLMYFVYLEIIELNFCGLNKYIKNNIQSRAIDEYKDIEKEGKGENDLKFSFELDGGFTYNFGNENDSEDKKEELNLNN